MEKLFERLERIPYFGFPIVCQIMAFLMAAGMPQSPGLKVGTIQRNERGLVIRLHYVGDDGETTDGCCIPGDFICVSTQPEPRVVLSNTGTSLIGGYQHQPPGLFFVFLFGLPTVVLLLPIILLIRAFFLAVAWSQGMNAQTAMTYFAIRGQLDPDVRETVRAAFRNARRGNTVDRLSMGIHMDLSDTASANF